MLAIFSQISKVLGGGTEIYPYEKNENKHLSKSLRRAKIRWGYSRAHNSVNIPSIHTKIGLTSERRFKALIWYITRACRIDNYGKFVNINLWEIYPSEKNEKQSICPNLCAERKYGGVILALITPSISHQFIPNWPYIREEIQGFNMIYHTGM